MVKGRPRRLGDFDFQQRGPVRSEADPGQGPVAGHGLHVEREIAISGVDPLLDGIGAGWFALGPRRR